MYILTIIQNYNRVTCKFKDYISMSVMVKSFFENATGPITVEITYEENSESGKCEENGN